MVIKYINIYNSLKNKFSFKASNQSSIIQDKIILNQNSISNPINKEDFQVLKDKCAQRNIKILKLIKELKNQQESLGDDEQDELKKLMKKIQDLEQAQCTVWNKENHECNEQENILTKKESKRRDKILKKYSTWSEAQMIWSAVAAIVILTIMVIVGKVAIVDKRK